MAEQPTSPAAQRAVEFIEQRIVPTMIAAEQPLSAETVGDLIIGLLHWWTAQPDREEADAIDLVTRVLGHYDAEAGPGDGIANDGTETDPSLGGLLQRYRLTSNYGTFEMHKEVWAASFDEAHDMTGVMTDLERFGWIFDESPDGEDHEVELLDADGNPTGLTYANYEDEPDEDGD